MIIPFILKYSAKLFILTALNLDDYNMNRKLKKSSVYISILLISLSGIFFGIEQGFNSLTISTAHTVGSLFVLGNHNLTIFFFIGTFLGILYTSILSYFLNRKYTFISILVILFFITSISCMLHYSLYFQLYFKLSFGFITGGISYLAPIYIIELSPSKKRGSNIALLELMITIGIFLVTLFKYFSIIDIFYNYKFVLIPVILVIILTIVYLDKSSPWSNFKKNKKAKASRENPLLGRIDKISFRFFLKLLILGISIQVLQQLSGINAVIYYSSRMFGIIGFDTPLFDSTAIILVKLFATLLVINLIDIIDRKKLLYFGFALMGVSMISCSFLFTNYSFGEEFLLARKLALLSFIFLYISAYAMSIGPIAWLVATEIFPIEYRNIGVAFTTFSNLFLNAIIAYTTLSIVDDFKISLIFLFFGIFSILGLFIVAFFIPETRNIELSEIKKNLKNNVKLKNIGELDAAKNEFTKFK